jgi:hypothetical protein
MRSFSWTGWFANGRNPSPVRRRLEKAPSPDTLSPRERATISDFRPRVQPKMWVKISLGGEGGTAARTASLEKRLTSCVLASWYNFA